MVTANGARFKDRNTIMNEQHQSYIDRYIRAKKRTEVTPKCLFGAPCRAETDRFLLQHELEQMKETREVYEKYDLSEIPEGDEKDNLFPEFERQDDKADEISVRFQPKVVTELDSPPSGSLFTPIEKVGSTGAVGSGETKLTDYWQTSKRRRSSSNLESNSEQTEGNDSDSMNHPEEVE